MVCFSRRFSSILERYHPTKKIFLIRALLEIPALTGPKGVLTYPLEGGGVASATKPFPHLSTASLTPAPPRVRDFNPARI